MQDQNKKSPNILLSADDGIYSQGIKCLAKEIRSRDYNLTVIAPRTQRSGVGKAITFDEPIRVEEIPLSYLDGESGWRITGTPADAVIHGIHERSQTDLPPYDLVVAGINAGENTSAHSLLTSGTCAVAFEAALLGHPAIAFSLAVHDHLFFDDRQPIKEYEIVAKIACKIIEKVLKYGLPEDVAFLNVNFPDTVTLNTPLEIVSLSPIKYVDYTIKKKDPRGVDYFWIWGNRVANFPEGTDVHTVLKKKMISITPITLKFDAGINESRKILNFLLK